MILYNLNLINYQMDRLGFTPEILAERAKISLPTAHVTLLGRLGTLKVLRRVADALLIKWEYITSTFTDERDFRRAVHTNGHRKGRSVKPGLVFGSANQPRSKELRT